VIRSGERIRLGLEGVTVRKGRRGGPPAAPHIPLDQAVRRSRPEQCQGVGGIVLGSPVVVFFGDQPSDLPVATSLPPTRVPFSLVPPPVTPVTSLRSTALFDGTSAVQALIVRSLGPSWE
jgi:hypothetical protein